MSRMALYLTFFGTTLCILCPMAPARVQKRRVHTDQTALATRPQDTDQMLPASARTTAHRVGCVVTQQVAVYCNYGQCCALPVYPSWYGTDHCWRAYIVPETVENDRASVDRELARKIRVAFWNQEGRRANPLEWLQQDWRSPNFHYRLPISDGTIDASLSVTYARSNSINRCGTRLIVFECRGGSMYVKYVPLHPDIAPCGSNSTTLVCDEAPAPVVDGIVNDAICGMEAARRAAAGAVTVVTAPPLTW